MEKLRYLSVPDFLWINQELTKKVLPYRFDRLEEGVFSQYAYGRATGPASQAASLMAGFKSMRPFNKGNDACALVGTIAFLRMNDHDLDLSPSEAAAWFRSNSGSIETARQAIADKVTHNHVHTHHGTPPTREIVGEVLADYSEALASLMADEAPVSLAG
jgi:prophage maintenance system killer protein